MPFVLHMIITGDEWGGCVAVLSSCTRVRRCARHRILSVIGSHDRINQGSTGAEPPKGNLPPELVEPTHQRQSFPPSAYSSSRLCEHRHGSPNRRQTSMNASTQSLSPCLLPLRPPRTMRSRRRLRELPPPPRSSSSPTPHITMDLDQLTVSRPLYRYFSFLLRRS